jgi:site-specific DNA-methyltransferase (adenine-specific)
MPNYTCERCLKEFSQKSHFDKHQNKKRPCQDNREKIEEVIENIIINKKLISNNSENIIINTMDSTKPEKKKPKLKIIEKSSKIEEKPKLKIIEKSSKIEEKSSKIEKKLSKIEKKEQQEKLLIEIDKHTLEDHRNDNTTLLFGDCLERMKEIPDDSVDLILCDLPYGTTKCKWDTIIDLTKLWAHYKRIIKKPTGVILLFGQQPFTSMLVSSNYEWFKYNLIWKKNKTTQYLLANYRPMKCTEDICVFSKGGAAAASRKKGNMTYNPQGLIPVDIKKKNSKERIGKMLNQSHHLGPNNKLISDSEYSQKFTNYPNELIEFHIESDTIHETQKPVKLIEFLIKTYSNEREIVLDNTMGSGTTGIGCVNTNRKFIGIELEEKYFKLSKHRIINTEVIQH